MPTKPICEECGAELPANAPQELCPRCLAGMALSLLPGDASDLSGLERTASPATSNPPPPPHSRLRYFGDYELLEEIARGGMGVVYRARQVSLNRIVALKMLLFGKFSSDEFVRRFQTEAQAVASLQHPNIVALHEVGAHDGQHYFSMDYVAGQNLAELVREHPLPARRAADYIETVAEAVHYAHQHGILHRDLKPSNVLLDEFDRPRLTDFGLAKQLTTDSELTPTGQVLGSPNYMPPEQADPQRGPPGPPSDVYSLGAILHHLLTGRPPFLAETLEGTLRQVLNNEPVAPRRLNPSVPPDLETICLKCLEKEPRRRYPSAPALADELARFSRGEPIAARPLNRVDRLWRWCRREPATASLLGGLLIAFGLGFGGVTFEWQRAEHFRRLADVKTEQVRADAEANRSLQYANEMNLASRAWDDGNWIRALSLIKQQRPKAGEKDLRGFEWRHLWWLGRGDYKFALPYHNQVVGSMTFSPDGNWLATFAWDDTVRVWNLASPRKPILVITNAAALGGFAAGGTDYIVGRRDGTITQYQLGSGAGENSLTNAGELLAVASNGHTVVTFDENSQLLVQDLAPGQLRFQVPGILRRRLDYGWDSGIALAPEGNLLAVVEQRENPLRLDRGIQLWETQSGKPRGFLSMNRQIRSLQFSPDGQTLAVGDGEGVVWLWRLATMSAVTFKLHTQPVLSLAFSNDGQTLASGGADETIGLWDLVTHTQKLRTFRGQSGAVWSLAFSPDGSRLAAGSRNTTVKIWEVATARTPPTSTNLLSDLWGNFAFSPDSKLMAAGCKDRMVRVWEVATKEERAVLPGLSYVVAFSQDGKRLLVSTQAGIPAWRDWATSATTPLPTYRGDIEGQVACAVLSPDRQTVALGLNSGDIQFWDLATGRFVTIANAHPGGVASLVFSPGGDKLVSGGRDKSVAVWDVPSRTKLDSSFEHRGSVCALAMSADGKLIASGCSANAIRFWNAAELATAVATVPYHESVIRTLAFAPDGITLASGSEDNTVKLWSVLSHEEVASFKCDAHVRLVTFSPDGNHLAVVTDRGTLTVYHAMSLNDADRPTETIE